MNWLLSGALFLSVVMLALSKHKHKHKHELSRISSKADRDLKHICGRRPGYKYGEDDKHKIYRGHKAKPNQYPWAADIYIQVKQKNGKMLRNHYCGGTLITRKHVMTAAHCVNKPDKHQQPCNGIVEFNEAYRVFVGSLKTGKGHEIKVKRMIDHPRWGTGRGTTKCSTGGDIALLELKKKVPRKLIKKGEVGFACLPKANLQYAHHALVSHGWGKTLDPKTEDDLMWAKMAPLDSEECEERHGGIPDDVVCIAEVNTNVCAGDSGGPLLQLHKKRWTAMGVVSFGSKCENMAKNLLNDKAEYAGGTFTDVRKYGKWICRKTGACYHLKHRKHRH